MGHIAAGRRIHEYVLDQQIGRGGFSEVWRAHHHIWTDQFVAFKIPTNADYIRNLQREGTAIHGLNHPNIVRATGLDPYHDPPYLMMEYIPGTSLRPLIQQGRLSPLNAVSILRQVLAGLAAAHKIGVIHRDVKPENILIDDRALTAGFAAEGVVKVADFGLGGAAAQTVLGSIQMSRVSQDGSIAGTLDYMAPEQRKGGDIDERADLYACGVLLYEMLAGELPEGWELPSTRNPKSPAYLDEVFKRSYARLDKRFATAVEFSEAPNPPSRLTVATRLVPELAAPPPAVSLDDEAIDLRDDASISSRESTAEPPAEVQVNHEISHVRPPLVRIPRLKTRERVNSLGMTFIRIEPGTFQMGSPDNENGRASGETPHQVTVTRPFFMGIHQVTCGQFAAFVRDSGYKTAAEKHGWALVFDGANFTRTKGISWKSPGFDQTLDHPVVEVSWYDAAEFRKWLSAKEGKSYRLPSEFQWEYACRAGTQTAYFWGNSADAGAGFANCADQTAKEKFPNWNPVFNWRDGYVFTSPVGAFRANPWGLYDMAGNVWEWCNDYYGPYGKSDSVDPAPPAIADEDSSHVLRGGSWLGTPSDCRSACRGKGAPGDRNNIIGFRLCLNF